VVSELHGEKIDIIDWAEDPATYVGNALSPAHVVSSTVVDAVTGQVRVVVPDFQLSLAIGREGQNARLAARLTGYRIDIHSDSETVEPPTEPSTQPSTQPPTEPAHPSEPSEVSGSGESAAPDPGE